MDVRFMGTEQPDFMIYLLLSGFYVALVRHLSTLSYNPQLPLWHHPTLSYNPQLPLWYHATLS